MKNILIIILSLFSLSLVAQETLVEDASYSWWCDPISKHRVQDGFNYFTTVGNDGAQQIHRWKEGNAVETEVLKMGRLPDEHNTPAFLFLQDSILVGYCGHNNDGDFHIQKMGYDFGVDTTKRVEISSGIPSSQLTYSQMYQYENKILIWTRAANQVWWLMWSEDDAATWSYTSVFDGSINPLEGFSQVYITGSQQDSVIFFTQNFHPNTDDVNRINTFRLNLETGNLYSAQHLFGSVYNENFNSIAVTTDVNVVTVHNALSGYKLRMLDNAILDNYIVVAYDDLFVANTDLGSYGYSVFDPYTGEIIKDIKLAKHGRILTAESYSGGVYFVKNFHDHWNKELMIAREENGNYFVERYGVLQNYEAVLSRTYLKEPTTIDLVSYTRPYPPKGAATGRGFKFLYQKLDFDGTFIGYLGSLNIFKD